jgi:hypothetical protein
MALNGTPLTPVSVFTANVFPPLPNSAVESADVAAGEQALLNRTEYLEDAKVDRDGDTMTGGLTITPPTPGDIGLIVNAAPNTNGVNVVGSGTGVAVDIAGAANSAMVVTAADAAAAVAIANSAGPGLTIIGSTSSTIPALGVATATAQSAASPRIAISSNGYLAFTGPDPNDTVDPGANNAVHALAIPKAWVLIDNTYSVLRSYNVSSVTNVAGSVYELTFVRPMATVNYGVSVTVSGAPGVGGGHNGNKSTSSFRFVLYDTTNKSLGFSGATEALIVVYGEQ